MEPLPSSVEPALLEDPGYTPKRADLQTVLGYLLEPDEKLSRLALRALLRAGLPAGQAALERLARTPPAARSPLLVLLGRLAQAHAEPWLPEALASELGSPEPRVRRAAIVALGKLREVSPEHQALLVARFREEQGPELRALIETLGKVGGTEALTLLEQTHFSSPTESELRRKAQLLLTRRCRRTTEAGRVELEVCWPSPERVVLFARDGLAFVVEEQLAGLAKVRRAGQDRLFVDGFTGPAKRLLAARSLLGFGVVLELEASGPEPEAVATAVATRLLAPRTLALLTALTAGTPRLRFAVQAGGHQRRLMWALSQALEGAAPRLLVDPEQATFEVTLVGRERLEALWLIPRGFDDPRFAYRKAELPFASHPTVAAALAHLLGVQEDDVIWDPFVGSGLELVERAKLGPYRALLGTDRDPLALEAARTNAAAAAVEHLELRLGDARTEGPDRVTGIVTNPPLGSRVNRDGSLGELLEAVLERAARVLVPGGRLVWLSPMPARTKRLGERLGFSVHEHGAVDLSGLRPILQVMRRPGHA